MQWGVGKVVEVSYGESPSLAYAGRVGQRLRSIRKQKKLSLQEVEENSGHEFKASVLGAYERGERVISVPRLQRLAGFYNVPVDQLLPATVEPPPETPVVQVQGAEINGARRPPDPRIPDKVTFDLARFKGIEGDRELAMVHKYLTSIQVLRQDFNGRMLTIRRDDIQAIAGLFGTDAGSLVRRLDTLKLRIDPA